MPSSASLLDAFEVTRPKPENLRPEDDALFRHEYRRRFDRTDLHVLRDVLLTPEGVFVRRFRAVPELRYVPQEKMGPRYVAPKLLKRRRRFDTPGERYVTAFNRWSAGNYFHWTCDVLPRVYLAREHVEGGVFVLPESHRHAFVEESLEPFGAKRIEYFGPDEVASFAEVVVPGHIGITGNYHEPTMRQLARFLRGRLGVAEAPPDRLVYVTRRGSQHRYVANEEELLPVLERHAFEVVVNEGLPFAEQVRLYSRVRALVGIMGANLANTLFMPAGGALLQLSRRGDAANHAYYSLASAKGVRFYYQQCDWVEAGYGIRWNLTVDPEELDRTLGVVLGDPASSD